MEAELVALATTGATALVQQMVGDGWERVRTRVAAFFAARSGSDEAAVGAELDAVREELLQAERTGDEDATAEARDEARAEWRSRMRRTLRADPEAATELRGILAELAGEPGASAAPQTTIINNTIENGSFDIALQVGIVHRGHIHHTRTDGPRAAPGSGAPSDI
ncbi:hypothetical protein [Streptomyces sp. NPDC090025]|uniref:hypothetical protein n=1 Tax=Streptomyces sp. NPDC090025 TaxID=3365922 RepID=UPI003832D243